MQPNKRELALEQLRALTDEDRQLWKTHPVTKCIIAILEADLEDIKENWLNGVYTTESGDGTLQKNAEAIGSAGAIEDVVDYMKSVHYLGSEEID